MLLILMKVDLSEIVAAGETVESDSQISAAIPCSINYLLRLLINKIGVETALSHHVGAGRSVLQLCR